MILLPYDPWKDDLRNVPCPLPGCAGHLVRELLKGGELAHVICLDPGCDFSVTLAPTPGAPGYRVVDGYRSLQRRSKPDARPCAIAGCPAARVCAAGLCNKHRLRQLRSKQPMADFIAGGGKTDGQLRRENGQGCRIDGCPALARVRGVCRPHYFAWFRAGKPDLEAWITDRSIAAGLREREGEA